MRMSVKVLTCGWSGDKARVPASPTLSGCSSMATKAGALYCGCPGKALWRSSRIQRWTVFGLICWHMATPATEAPAAGRLGNHLRFELCAVKPPHRSLLCRVLFIVSTISLRGYDARSVCSIKYGFTARIHSNLQVKKLDFHHQMGFWRFFHLHKKLSK